MNTTAFKAFIGAATAAAGITIGLAGAGVASATGFQIGPVHPQIEPSAKPLPGPEATAARNPLQPGVPSGNLIAPVGPYPDGAN